MINGDFNMHHPTWSSADADKENKSEFSTMNSKSSHLLNWMHANKFVLMNIPGEITFFRREYTCAQSHMDLG